MKPYFSARFLFAVLALAAALGARPASAAQTDLSPVPLGTASSTSVLPNLMFILDDSGSMGRHWMPDNVDASSTCKSYTLNSNSSTDTNCILDSGGTNTVSPTADNVRHVPTQGWPAGPSVYTAEFNTIYYNPQITYSPGKDSGGADLPSFGSPWTAVKVNPYVSNNAINLTTQYPEPVFCTSNTSVPTDNVACRRNGYDTTGTSLLTSGFRYSNASADATGGYGWPISTTAGAFRFIRMRFGAPHYYTILPREYCKDVDLNDCLAAAGTPTAPVAPNGTHTIPAPVRYCTTALAANQDAAVTANTPATCQAKIDASHANVRYGTFVRTDIVPSVATYGGRPNRSDCLANPVCSYDEEMTNFANWLAYYHTRMQTMKSSAGRVFSSMDDRYRIGFVTINASDATRYLKIDKFSVTHKADWYTKFYAMTPSANTPLRRALSRVGRHYAGKTDAINSFMPDDPVQFSCQQNFALLTTDGYWNSTGGLKLDGTTAMDNQDNVVETFVNRPTGTLDAAGTTSTNSSTTRTLEQTVCTGNAANSANFSGTPDTNCGCPVNLKRVKQRTLDTITSTSTVDGVTGLPTTANVATFQDVFPASGCDATRVTQATPVTVVERRVCTGAGSTTFTYGGTQTCNCGTNRRVYIRQTKTGATQNVTTYDGGAPQTTITGGGNLYEYSTTGLAGSWQAAPITGNTCTNAALTATAPVITPTGGTTTTTTGSTITAANFTISPNPTVQNLGASTSTAVGGFADTLADVAMYYYKNDLRPCPGGTPLDGKCVTDPRATDNVLPTTKDTATHQHMVTFTLGLGLDGLMNYQSDYETANSGDFKNIKDGVSGCSFAPGGAAAVCNWPQPVADAPSALDDLWHAAVNGRGIYFSAKNPNQLQGGLTSALAAIKTTTGAAASSATSTPNVTPSDNFIYSSTYRTVKWDGEVVAEKIDTVTGAVIPGIAWSVGPGLDARTLAASDDRAIYTFDPGDASDRLKPFLYGDLSGTEAAFFDNHCTVSPTLWPQCGAMSVSVTDLAIANSGANLVNYLRGQKQHETNYFRFREHTLGDTVNAKPAFLGKPNLIYGDAVVPDYNSFKAGPAASRKPALFVASNDGMLHAFHGGEAAAGGGTELWAYVPRMLLPELFKLAATNYDVNHRFFVDGSPVTMDVFLGGEWKTMLVGGLNAGGRGFFALDVTDTSSPKGMWEICSNASLCAVSDPDLGYSFGQAIITKRPSDGKWVVIVTSGYNNVSPGDGGGYLYVLDAATGAVLSKTPTAISGVNVGDTATPSGFAKISGFATNFAVNNTTTIVYGGDLLGNVWRFDLSADSTVPDGVTVQRIGQTLDGSSPPKPQSITTRPEITRFDAGFNVVYVGTGRFLGKTDIPDPATLVPPLNLAYQQSIYGIKDTGTDLGNLRAPAANLVPQTMTIVPGTTNRTTSNNAVDWSTQNGWWVDLNPGNSSPGERVNLDPQLVRGVLLLVSNEPNNEACSSGGNSFLYQFDYRSGSYVAAAPGLVVGIKLGSALAAGFVVYRLPTGQLKYTGIDVTGQKQTGGVIPGGGGALGRRATWRELYQ